MSLILGAVIFAASNSLAATAASAALNVVDYRYYALDSWIGAIGLPDDSFKCVVDADGQFLTEYGAPQGIAGVYPAQNRVAIRADLLGGTVRIDQRMHSPRAPIAVTHKRQGDVAITERLFLARPLNWSANIKGNALKQRDSKPDCRQYLLMVEYANQGTKATEVVPIISMAGAVAAARSADSCQSFSAKPKHAVLGIGRDRIVRCQGYWQDPFRVRHGAGDFRLSRIASDNGHT